MGHMELIAEFMILWENCFTRFFPWEGNRPSITWVATLDGPKTISFPSEFPSDLAEMFPEHMRPTHNASDALKAMRQYCVGASSPTIEAVNISGHSVSAHDFQIRVQALLDAAVAPSAITDARVKRGMVSPAQRRLGIVGGMGPVAGAVFTAELSSLLLSQPDRFQGWEVVMYSDPAVETAKHELYEAWKSLESWHGIFGFLKHPSLTMTCMSTNTGHLALQPSPESCLWCSVSNFLSIFEAVAQECAEEHKGKKVALMCTSMSMKFVESGYAEIMKKHNVEFVAPTDEIQEKCMAGIQKVKTPIDGARSWAEAVECFKECMLWYSNQGVSVFALACTEIPVVLKAAEVRKDERFKERDIQIVDSVVSLAQYVSKHLDQ